MIGVVKGVFQDVFYDVREKAIVNGPCPILLVLPVRNPTERRALHPGPNSTSDLFKFFYQPTNSSATCLYEKDKNQTV